MNPDDQILAGKPEDERWLRRAIELSRQSRDTGKHPFGALVVDSAGRLLAVGCNAFDSDCTGHAEMNAVRAAHAFDAAALAGATLFSSAEPCAMCSGAIYWSGIGRVVYALSETRLLEITGAHPANLTLSLPCREVFARGQRSVDVRGPMLENEAARVHEGFWL
jgi:tRNA(Arg) A34 adenosine deaminase TadA